MAAGSDQAVLGRGFALVHGDLVLDGGQIRIIDGRANFSQALQVALGTPFGSDPVNTGYGLDVAAIYTVAASIGSVKDLIRLNIVKSLAADGRVTAIDDVVFDDEPGFATLAPELAGGDPGAVARRGRIWHAAVSLTSAGGPQAILIGVAAP